MALRRLDKSFTPTSKQLNYLNKSFSDWRQSLINFAKVYFPDSYSDFNEASPGMMFIEMSSYLGDVLGYYIDSQFKENLIQYASEQENVLSIAQSLGYIPKPTTAATTQLDVYQIVPAQGAGASYAPDAKFFIRIKPGMVLSTDGSSPVTFRTIDMVNFADPADREITTYSIDNFNHPTYYLVKKTVKVVAGTIKTYDYTFGTPQKFSKIVLPDTDVLDIISVIDANGNTWYQVDYLAQDLIIQASTNTTADDPTFSVPPANLMKIVRTPRRFVTRYNENYKLELHFGSGVLDDIDSTINLQPNKIANSEYTTNLASTALDPSDFLSSRSYGLAPSGLLTITYSTGGGIASNVPSNSITKITTFEIDNDISTLSAADLNVWNTAVQSISVNNSVPATGGKDADSVQEIKENAAAFFNAQNRLVTAEDYVVRTFAMPAKFGGVAKAYVVTDEQINNIQSQIAMTGQSLVTDNPGNGVINLYTLGFNSNRNLVWLNNDTKENLKTYLDQYRMLTDNVRILDAFVVNIGVEFKVIVFKGFNMNEVLTRCIDAVNQFFDIDKWKIGQPIVINDLYLEIAAVEGVQSIVSLSINNKYQFKDGGDYNNFIYDIDSATKNGVIYTSLDPMIWEIRNPEKDIVGSAIQ